MLAKVNRDTAKKNMLRSWSAVKEINKNNQEKDHEPEDYSVKIKQLGLFLNKSAYIDF